MGFEVKSSQTHTWTKLSNVPNEIDPYSIFSDMVGDSDGTVERRGKRRILKITFEVEEKDYVWQ